MISNLVANGSTPGAGSTTAAALGHAPPAERRGDGRGRPGRAQLVAAAVVAGALVVGASVGVAADRTLEARQAATGRAGTSLDRFAAELSLSDGQRAAVGAMLEERQRVMDSLVGPVRSQLDSVKLAVRQRIRSQLTAPQQQRYDAYVARMELEEKARRRR